MTRAVLDKLLLHSLENYQALFNGLKFHNHNAHHLGSLYLLGANDDKLKKVYERQSEWHDLYQQSPYQINLSNWRTHLGNRNCCKSYRDFFSEQLINCDDWHKKLLEFLLDNEKTPLINGAVCGVTHPLIHLGYAFELDSQTVAIETLEMFAVVYNDLHKVIDKLELPKSPLKSAMEIFKEIHSDKQLPIYDAPDIYTVPSIVENYTDRILVYYDQWLMNKDNLEKAVEELFDLSVYVYGATHKPNDIEFDFFLVHLLTSMHAIRMIYPHINNQRLMEHILLQFFYFALVLYINRGRPEINEYLIHDYTIDNEKANWNYAVDRLLNTDLIDDAHVVKAVRALKEADKVYGSKDGLYLKTAIKTVDNMNLWIIDADDDRKLNIIKSDK